MKEFFITSTWILFLSVSVFAQQAVEKSDEIFVTGELDQALTISLEDLQNLPSIKIPDLEIINHKGEAKRTLTNLRGIPISEILKPLNFSIQNPKELSQIYFSFIASDDYTVVYSWNELYNSPTAEHVFIVTELEGKSIHEMDDSILMVNNSDYHTGRRHVKNLDRIIVKKVNN